MDAIRWEGNTLYLLDQTKLPVTEVWLPHTDYRPVADAIRTMVVRGAPAIGNAAAFGMYLGAKCGSFQGHQELIALLEKTGVLPPVFADLFNMLLYSFKAFGTDHMFNPARVFCRDF